MVNLTATWQHVFLYRLLVAPFSSQVLWASTCGAIHPTGLFGMGSWPTCGDLGRKKSSFGLGIVVLLGDGAIPNHHHLGFVSHHSFNPCIWLIKPPKNRQLKHWSTVKNVSHLVDWFRQLRRRFRWWVWLWSNCSPPSPACGMTPTSATAAEPWWRRVKRSDFTHGQVGHKDLL